MKQGIHPQYVECTVTCSCGNTFKTHATVSEMKVELCNECHPFYTGQQKFVDTGGRVQRFADKFGGAAAAQLKKAEEAKAAKAAKAAEAEALARPPLRLRLPRRLSVLLSSPRRLPSRPPRLPQRLPSRRPLPRSRPPRLLSK